MASELVVLQEKGLTPEEAKMVHDWETAGRPGIARIKSDFLSSIYNLGYSCQQIHQQFPEYALPAILWARAYHEWDARRTEYQRTLTGNTMGIAAEAHLEGIGFLAMVMKATHLKWKQDIVRWMAAPDREKPPEFLPTSMHQYMNAQKQLAEMITPPAKKGEAAASGPQVFINAPGATVSNVDPKQVANAMIDEMKKKAETKK
jgi:hypothetical protein